MASRREIEKKKQRQRVSTQEWADKQERGFEPTAYEVPEGVSLFGFRKVGSYEIDIVPYITGGRNLDADEGFEHFVCNYWSHDGMGVDGKERYCCPAKMLKKPCPICEWVAAHQTATDKATKAMVQKFKAKQRCLFCVIDRNEPAKGIQVWDTAYWMSFGEALKNKAGAHRKYANFWHPEGGRMLILEVKEASFEGRSYKKVANIEMEEREDLDADIAEQAPCLDDMLVIPSYEELKKIFEGAPTPRSKDDEEEKPAARRSARDDDDEPDDKGQPTADEYGLKKGMAVLYKGKECTIERISPDGTSLTLEDENGKEYRGVGPEEVKLAKKKPAARDEDDDPEDDEEEEEKPTRGKSSATKAGKSTSSKKDEDDDDPEDEEEDEEEALEDADPDDDEEEEDEKPQRRPATKKPAAASRRR